jgi:outer membrane protein TolC
MGPVTELGAATLKADVAKIRSEQDAALAQERVSVLLRKPIDDKTAVQIALINNRGLQAAYNDLGITEAQLAKSALPPNPSFSYSLLATGGALEIERQIAMNIMAILTLPKREEIAAIRFRAAQLLAMNETLRTAAETRRAFIRAVAAAQTVTFLEKAKLSAEAISELAVKLGETGALNKLDQAREHAFYAELAGQLGVARLKASTEREKLTRLMGLWGVETAYRLPSSLRPLPRRPKSLTEVERDAVANRVDLELLRLDLKAQAQTFGLTEATRFVDLLTVRLLDNREKQTFSDQGFTTVERLKRQGYDFEFEVPLFDFGQTKVAQARETYLRSVNLLIDKAVAVRSEARAAYTTYRATYDIARHYRDNVAPLRKVITDEGLLRYNGMLTDLFQLLTDARGNVTSTVAGIEAMRDFYLAQVDLQTALVGGGQSEASPQMSAGPEASSSAPH